MSETDDPFVNLSGNEVRPDGAKRQLPDELKAFEARLAALSPREDRLDRDRLMFVVGQASMTQHGQQHPRSHRASREVQCWRLAFSGMTAVAATLLVLSVMDATQINQPVLNIDSLPGSPTTIERSSVGADPRSGTLQHILSTSDARRFEFDRFLAATDAAAIPNGTTIEQPGTDLRPKLTPARWRTILDGEHPQRDPSSSKTFQWPRI